MTYHATFSSINSSMSSFDIKNSNQKTSIDNKLSNDLKSLNEVTDNNAFLPGSNLTISEYIEGEVSNYNLSIQSLNSTHIKVLCKYDKLPSPFYSYVNRTSIQPYYNVSNYYNLFFCEEQDIFDFWIDESNFMVGNTLVTPELTLTISETSINLAGVGTFDAWKLSGTYISIPIVIYYEKNTGLFLSQYVDFVSVIWLNLTKAEMSQIPVDYEGPTIKNLSPKNNSARPSDTPVICILESPYGIKEIYFQWDDGINSSIKVTNVETEFPLDNGSHYLYITAIDNLFKIKNYLCHFTTDNTIPGIFLEDFKNNSLLKGNSSLKINITSSNNSLFYNWDENANMSIIGPENDFIGIITTPQTEGLHFLSIYVMSIAGIWSMETYSLIIDNTPPFIYLKDFVNKTTIKDSLILHYNVSESCSLNYSLDNTTQKTIQVDPFQDYSLNFPNLTNGSHILMINATDLANNSELILLFFNIHAGSVDWPINISADQPTSLRVIDSNGKYWFSLIIVSRIDQRFNISLSEENFPSKTEKMLFVASFLCDMPEDIIFITLIYLVNNSSEVPLQSVEEYQWEYWDVNNQKWVEIKTIFNNIKNQWEATIERGDILFFALLKTGETITLESIIPGGGQVNSYEIYIVFIALLLSSKRRKRKTINLGD